MVSIDGEAALHLAVKHKRLDVLELLLSNGARLDVLDSTGKTALHIAARKANEEFVQVRQSH